MVKQALADGYCCVVGLQSTGEARAKGAAQVAGFDDKTGGQFDDYVCAPNEDLKRIIMMMFPLPPKPKGVIAPVFFNPDKAKSMATEEETSEAEEPLGRGRRKSMRSAKAKLSAISVDDDDDPNDDDDDDYDHESDDDADDESEDSDASVNAQGKRKTGRKTSQATKKQKKSSSRSRSKRVHWSEIPLDLDTSRSVANKRLVNYRKAVEMLTRYMEAVDKLELPPNPLDK